MTVHICKIKVYNSQRETTTMSPDIQCRERKNTHSDMSLDIGQFDLLRGFIGRLQLVFTCFVVFLLCSVNADGGYQMLQSKTASYLAKFGYIPGSQIETQNLMSQDDFTEAIKRLQRWGKLPPTGIIDKRTQELMDKKRCGVKDENFEENKRRRRKRYVLAPSLWHKKDLTFRILTYTPDLPRAKTRQAIYDGFKVWSDHTDLTFTEVISGHADIMIKFATKYHKDGYPFDGEGLVLAHAFYPGNDKGGDTHFDDDEHWTFNSSEKGVDLFMVAAHEFGHALGLGHSNEPGALMYPWYQGYQSEFQLPRDDIEGIQKLYGYKKGPLPPTRNRPRTTQRPRTRPDVTRGPRPPYSTPKPRKNVHPCDQRFDAIAVLRGELFLFIGEYFWRQDHRGLLGTKTPLHSLWYGLPEHVDHIDAVFERPDQKILMFVGNRYWMFNSNNLVARWPKNGRSITEFGIPDDIKKIDAVFRWGYNGRTYIISSDMYWKLNVENDHVEYDYPRDMKIWRNVPNPVDAAFQYWDEKTYFFHGDSFSQFYDNKMVVGKGYPKKIKDHWWGCGTRLTDSAKNIQVTPSGENRGHGLHASLITFVLTILIASI